MLYYIAYYILLTLIIMNYFVLFSSFNMNSTEMLQFFSICIQIAHETHI